MSIGVAAIDRRSGHLENLQVYNPGWEKPVDLWRCATMIRHAFAYLSNAYVFLVVVSVVFITVAVVTTVWMATTHSVAPELLKQLGPVPRASQDPRVEPHIPLNVGTINVFRIIEVPGWEYEFQSDRYEARLVHTLGILSLHNGGTYRIEPVTAPVKFVSALEAAAVDGVDGVEQFLVDAGQGASWRGFEYEGYETVAIHLVPNATENFLLRAWVGSAMMAIVMVPATFIAFGGVKRRSDT